MEQQMGWAIPLLLTLLRMAAAEEAVAVEIRGVGYANFNHSLLVQRP